AARSRSPPRSRKDASASSTSATCVRPIPTSRVAAKTNDHAHRLEYPMRRSDLTLCLITDEVSPSLDEGLAFARAEGVGTVDLRIIDGRNVMALSRGELADAAQRVRAAGLSVSCICTPLLKWSPPGSASQAKGDQFGFELG